MGINGQNTANFSGLDGRHLNVERTFSHIEASIDGEFPLPPGQRLTVTLVMGPTPGGFPYSVVAQITILGNSVSAAGDFGPTVFPAGSEHWIGAVLTGTAGAYNGPLKVTIS